MRAWAEAAAKEPGYGNAFDFEGIAYPKDVGSNVMRAVDASAETIARVVAEIEGMAGRRIIVAGHSSGAALAVSVVSRIADGGAITLISLDAGINTEAPPPPELHPIEHLECWSATSGDLLSFGYKRAQTLCKERFFVVRTDRCTTPVCLHYFLINRRAAEDLTFKQSRALDDGISGGYRNLSVNLSWLDRSR